MNDKELLEATARAAGIEADWNDPECADYEAQHEGMWLCGERSPSNSQFWNPLTDDGDRYRLLKALKMGIDFDAQSVIYTLDGSICEESFRDDGDDARAVLRAAAEIGRAMP